MTIGQRLKRARNNKGLSFEEIHRGTKIQPSVLAALEEDRAEDLLSPIYVRNFLKEYCQFLDLDTSVILKEYDSLAKSTPEPELVVGDRKKTPALPIYLKFKLNKTRLIYIVAGILILLIALGVVNLLRHNLKAVFARHDREIEKLEEEKAGSLIVPITEELRLTIRASDETWVRLEGDGEKLFEDIIHSGGSETWNADDSFKVWVGNAKNLNFILNGHDLGSPGRGVIKNIIVDHEGMKAPKRN